MRAQFPLVLVLALGIAGALLIPIQPMYASSGSMAPAIAEGDLYFVHEGATVQVGDVIAFESADRGELVTHRVIGEKPDGYVTKGDANPSTDQAAGHPIVARSSVVGTVVAVKGRPVTVARAGPLAAWLATYRPVLMGLGVLLVVVLSIRGFVGTDRSVPQRPVFYVSDVVTPLFIGSVLVCLLFVYWGASTHELNYVASQGSVTATHTVPVGEAVIRTVGVEMFRPPFTTVIVEANGVSVLERTATASGLEFRVEVPAQASTGLYQASVDVSTYPATLPRGVIEWLHGVHWLAAALGTIAPVYVPVYGAYLGFVDGRAPIRIPVARWLRQVGGG